MGQKSHRNQRRPAAGKVRPSRQVPTSPALGNKNHQRHQHPCRQGDDVVALVFLLYFRQQVRGADVDQGAGGEGQPRAEGRAGDAVDKRVGEERAQRRGEAGREKGIERRLPQA